MSGLEEKLRAKAQCRLLALRFNGATQGLTQVANIILLEAVRGTLESLTRFNDGAIHEACVTCRGVYADNSFKQEQGLNNFFVHFVEGTEISKWETRKGSPENDGNASYFRPVDDQKFGEGKLYGLEIGLGIEPDGGPYADCGPIIREGENKAKLMWSYRFV